MVRAIYCCYTIRPWHFPFTDIGGASRELSSECLKQNKKFSQYVYTRSIHSLEQFGFVFSFICLLVIVKASCIQIGWIFQNRGDASSIGTRDHVDGVGCVRGRNQRVDLLNDSNVRLTRVCVKVTKQRPVLMKVWVMV